MKKMYYAKKNLDVVFVLDDESIPITDIRVAREADHFLAEEGRNHVPKRLEVKEVNSLADLPKDWWQAMYWGDNDHDNTPSDFLQDPEYKEYLRLKAKFEE